MARSLGGRRCVLFGSEGSDEIAGNDSVDRVGGSPGDDRLRGGSEGAGGGRGRPQFVEGPIPALFVRGLMCHALRANNHQRGSRLRAKIADRG